MKQKRWAGLATGVVCIFMLSSLATAATVDIAVTAAGDRVYHKDWSSFGNYASWNTHANPNVVQHYYDYYSRYGYLSNTHLSFDLTPVTIPVTDILSVSLNYNIIDIWTDGRDGVAGFSGGGSVLYSQGTGWKSFDVTDSFKNLLTNSAAAADYAFSYTGFSGFTFSSAEGGAPAFLRITTTGPSAVPIPGAAWLLGAGLAGLAGLRRKDKA